MRIYSLSIVFVVFSIFVNAQSYNDVLEKTHQNMNANTELSYNSTYSLYKTTTSSDLHERYTGVYKKTADNEMYCKIDKTEFISNKQLSLTISHDEKIVRLSQPNFTLPTATSFSTEDLDKHYKKEDFKDKGDYWEIVLLPKSITSEYRKIVLHISKTYELKQQQFFYAKGIDFSTDYRTSDIQYPRLEITYNNYNKMLKNHDLFKTASYLTFTEDKKMVLAPHLANYEVLDIR